MINIVEKVTNRLREDRARRPVHANNASKVGFPCNRYLVYRRLNWKEALLPDTGLLYIFEEGNTHETAVVQLLMKSGLTFSKSQTTLDWPDLETTGSIDGMVGLNGEQLPIEIKSSNQFTWEKLNNQDDLKASEQIWVKCWYGQLQMYLWMCNEQRMILLLKNKQSGQLKQIEITIDMDYSNELAERLDEVNLYVGEKKYPDRITDRTICSGCDFKHLCLPDEESETVNIDDNPEVLSLLEQREAVREAAKEFGQVDKKVKTYFKAAGEGLHLVGGKFQVKLTTVKKTKYDIPDEIKEKYKGFTEYIRSIITCLK